MIEIDLVRFQHLAPGECKQPMRQGCAAFGSAADHQKQTSDFVGNIVPPIEQIGRAEDRSQKIVEVVGDSSGKLTDSLHFLGLQGGVACLL